MLPSELELHVRVDALAHCMVRLAERIAAIEAAAAAPAPPGEPSAEVFFYGEKVGRVIADRPS